MPIFRSSPQTWSSSCRLETLKYELTFISQNSNYKLSSMWRVLRLALIPAKVHQCLLSLISYFASFRRFHENYECLKPSPISIYHLCLFLVCSYTNVHSGIYQSMKLARKSFLIVTNMYWKSAPSLQELSLIPNIYELIWF